MKKIQRWSEEYEYSKYDGMKKDRAGPWCAFSDVTKLEDALKAERDLVDEIESYCSSASVRPDIDIMVAIDNHRKKRGV